MHHFLLLLYICTLQDTKYVGMFTFHAAHVRRMHHYICTHYMINYGTICWILYGRFITKTVTKYKN